MGIDYTASTAVGYYVTDDEISRLFGRDLPEKFHMEDRFDPRTGKKVDPEKVVDQEAGRFLFWKGEQVGGADDDYPGSRVFELVELLADELGCSWWEDGGMEDHEGFVLGMVPPVGTGADWGHVSTAGDFLLDDLVALRKDIRALGRRLQKMGFEVEPPRVFTVVSFG